MSNDHPTTAQTIFRFFRSYLWAILLFLLWHVVWTRQPLSNDVLLTLPGLGAALIFLLRSWRAAES